MEVVLVTAGNGFVGQHFVKHLQTHGPTSLREIRVLDSSGFQKQLAYTDRVPVRSFVGTVFDAAKLEDALDGTDTVVHLYEFKDTSMLPNRDTMKQINVKGTEVIIAACKSHPTVKRFLHLSSIDILLGNQVACDSGFTELAAVPVNQWAYPDYCASKYEAENIALACDAFQTAAVRLGPLYGELDDQEWGVAAHLKLGKWLEGTIPTIGDRHGNIMYTYVGNAAYGMVKVLEKLVADKSATKEAVFLLDETPLKDFYSLLEPIAKAKGYKFYSIPIWFLFFFFPYWIFQSLVLWTEFIDCFGLKRYVAKLPSARVVFNYCYTYSAFLSLKAFLYFGYKPLYTYEQAMEKCIKHYAVGQY